MTIFIKIKVRLYLLSVFNQVVGRKAPTEAEPSPEAYRMKLFAPNPVIAKSRFWYFMHQVIVSDVQFALFCFFVLLFFVSIIDLLFLYFFNTVPQHEEDNW